MTLPVRSAGQAGSRHPRRRAVVSGVAVTTLSLGMLLGSAVSAVADPPPPPGPSLHLPFPAHPHTQPDCFLCIM